MRIDRLASAQLAACAVATVLAAALGACGQENRYVAPPLPRVTVAIPVQQKVTRYLEATGYTAAINTSGRARAEIPAEDQLQGGRGG